MVPAYIIALRESIEASLIIATIIGILTKLRYRRMVRQVWTAVVLAFFGIMTLIIAGSFLGNSFQTMLAGDTQETVEAVLTIISAFFITWAVLFLHRAFARGKAQFLAGIRTLPKAGVSIFFMTFVSVLREGIEAAVFLSTTYLTSQPFSIIAGSLLGILTGVGVSLALFTTTLKMSVWYAFRVTTALLILFAGGMIAKSVHILIALGYLHPTQTLTVSLLPSPATLTGGLIQTVFGLNRAMDTTELLSALMYTVSMVWILRIDRLFRHHAAADQ